MYNYITYGVYYRWVLMILKAFHHLTAFVWQACGTNVVPMWYQCGKAPWSSWPFSASFASTCWGLTFERPNRTATESLQDRSDTALPKPRSQPFKNLALFQWQVTQNCEKLPMSLLSLLSLLPYVSYVWCTCACSFPVCKLLQAAGGFGTR